MRCRVCELLKKNRLCMFCVTTARVVTTILRLRWVIHPASRSGDHRGCHDNSQTLLRGCTSFFCMGVAPPRMGRSRTARVPRVRCARRGSEAFSLGSRSRQVACLELRVRSTQEKAQQQPFDLLPPLLILFLVPGHTKRSAGVT